MVSKIRLVILGLVLQAIALGARVELVVWKPEAEGPKLLLPVPEGKTPETVAAHYLQTLFDDSELDGLLSSHWVSEATGTFTRLDDEGPGDRPWFGLIDNDFDPRRDELKTFEQGGAEAFLLPLASELALDSTDERAQYRHLVADRMQALVSLGGEHDIAPELYGEPVTYARDTNIAWDRMESRLLADYMAVRKGVLYGICRGHQLIAVTLGYKMIQDLEKEIGAMGHGDDFHPIRLADFSLLKEWVGGKSPITVNSYHHQAVIHASNPHGPLKEAAVAGNGPQQVTEALESEDRKVITFQFHPELLKNELGRTLIREMVRHASVSSTRLPR